MLATFADKVVSWSGCVDKIPTDVTVKSPWHVSISSWFASAGNIALRCLSNYWNISKGSIAFGPRVISTRKLFPGYYFWLRFLVLPCHSRLIRSAQVLPSGSAVASSRENCSCLQGPTRPLFRISDEIITGTKKKTEENLLISKLFY